MLGKYHFYLSLTLTFLVLLAACKSYSEISWKICDHSEHELTLFSMAFCDSLHAFAVGEKGIILYSVDGGFYWDRMKSFTTLNLNNIRFVSDSTGWIVGDQGIIYFSSNAGKNWISKKSGTKKSLKHIHFVNNNIGYIVGDGGVVLYSNDGGQHWSFLRSDVNTCLNSIAFYDSLNGIAVGDGPSVIYTYDGGINWNKPDSVLLIDYSSRGMFKNLKDIYFVNKSIAYAVGDINCIMVTNNSGRTWKMISCDNEQEWYINIALNSKSIYGYNSIYFNNSQTGWIAGSSGKFLFTLNGGLNWYSKETIIKKDIYDLCSYKADKLFAVGENGTIAYLQGALSSSDEPGWLSTKIFSGIFFLIGCGLLFKGINVIKSIKHDPKIIIGDPKFMGNKNVERELQSMIGIGPSFKVKRILKIVTLFFFGIILFFIGLVGLIY